jgi:hypothetical protein
MLVLSAYRSSREISGVFTDNGTACPLGHVWVAHPLCLQLVERLLGRIIIKR